MKYKKIFAAKFRIKAVSSWTRIKKGEKNHYEYVIGLNLFKVIIDLFGNLIDIMVRRFEAL